MFAPISSIAVTPTNLFKAGLITTHVVGVSVIGLGWAIGETAGLISSALGVGMVLVCFTFGQLIEIKATQLANYAGMALVLLSYALRVGGIALVMGMIVAKAGDNIDRIWLFVGTVSAVFAWASALVTLATFGRQLIYDDQQLPTESAGRDE